MANLFNKESVRPANYIEDTLTYVLRQFFSMDDTYTYCDDSETADPDPEEEDEDPVPEGPEGPISGEDEDPIPEDDEDPEPEELPQQEPLESRIIIVPEYAIKGNEDEAIPMIIIGNATYDANLSMTLGGNYFQPYRSPIIEGSPIVGNQYASVIPFSCVITFLGKNEFEIEMIAEQLTTYFGAILNHVLATFGINISNVRFGAGSIKANYPVRKYFCTLVLNGALSSFVTTVSNELNALFEDFVVQFMHKQGQDQEQN